MPKECFRKPCDCFLLGLFKTNTYICKQKKGDMIMRKKILTMSLLCSMAMSVNAQVFAYDTWMQMPTRDIYDDGAMNMYARALAETAARRKANFEKYSNLADEAFNKKQWNYVIYYVNEALETQYYNGELFFLRGCAYEMLGNERQAKKDYRKGKKNGSYRAALAMEQLKEKQKQRRKRK